MFKCKMILQISFLIVARHKSIVLTTGVWFVKSALNLSNLPLLRNLGFLVFYVDFGRGKS